LREPADNLLIGAISLMPYSDTDNRGFWIAHEHLRKGYMTEAVVAVNDFAFDQLGMDALLLNNAEPNIASHRLKEKSGATIINIEDNVPFVGGNFRSIRWRLTREAWAANRHRLLRP